MKESIHLHVFNSIHVFIRVLSCIINRKNSIFFTGWENRMNLTQSNVIMLISFILMFAFLCYAFLYRQERGIRYFAGVMFCRVVYAGSVIMEINSDSLSTKLLSRKIEQTSLLFMVPMVIFLCSPCSGKRNTFVPFEWFRSFHFSLSGRCLYGRIPIILCFSSILS